MSSERLDNVETKLAYQEKLVDDLSDVLADQQQRIDALEAGIRRLAERLQSVTEPAAEGRPEDDVPPHY